MSNIDKYFILVKCINNTTDNSDNTPSNLYGDPYSGQVSGHYGQHRPSRSRNQAYGANLAQSTLVGVAIGIFDAEVWLKQDSVWINGFTYAMGAFFVQGIAYYFFKMFFEQNLQERVRHGNIEKQRSHQCRDATAVR